jgi:CheY-like chemotaxis protein
VTPSPLEQIRVLVVDDEKPARQRLIDLLRNDSQVGDILEAENGVAAVDTIQATVVSTASWQYRRGRRPHYFRLARHSGTIASNVHKSDLRTVRLHACV